MFENESIFNLLKSQVVVVYKLIQKKDGNTMLNKTRGNHV